MSEENKILTTKEAMQALLDGKKLKRPSWGPDRFLNLVDDKIVDQDNSGWGCNLNVGYQLYEEPKKKVKFYRVGYWFRNNNRPSETSLPYRSLTDFYDNYCGEDEKEDYRQVRLLMNTEQEYEVPE